MDTLTNKIALVTGGSRGIGGFSRIAGQPLDHRTGSGRKRRITPLTPTNDS